MKGTRLLLLLLVIGLVMTAGCGQKETASAEEQALMSKIELPAGAKKLSAAELRDIEQWLNADPIRTRFLQSTYETPETIDLYSLFYLGDGRTYDASEEEIRAFLREYGWWGEFRTSSVGADEMDAILRGYTGVPLAQTQRIRIDNLYYVSDLDRYYSLHGDAEVQPFDALCGYRSSETVCLYYTASIRVQTRMTGLFRATLRPEGDGYIFLSNEFCEDDGSGLTYRTETYQTDTDTSLPVEEHVELRTLQEVPALSADTQASAEAAIAAQPGFEPAEITGLKWLDISAYGTVAAGTIEDQTVIYYVRNDGTVFELPLFLPDVEPPGLMFGGGGMTFVYMMEHSEAVPGGSVTDWYGTLLLPENELYVRTVRGTLPGA